MCPTKLGDACVMSMTELPMERRFLVAVDNVLGWPTAAAQAYTGRVLVFYENATLYRNALATPHVSRIASTAQSESRVRLIGVTVGDTRNSRTVSWKAFPRVIVRVALRAKAFGEVRAFRVADGDAFFSNRLVLVNQPLVAVAAQALGMVSFCGVAGCDACHQRRLYHIR